MLEILGLRKSFGGRVAVDGVSFSIAPGEIVGVLGPNGAGKTTTVSMITGLLRPDAGEIRMDGRALSGDTDPAKLRLGLVPQELALYDELTARQNLAFFGGLLGMERAALDRAAASALALVGLADRAGDAVATFSGGMKRRLNLAAGVLHDPQVLLLDEPTVGVDPQSRNAIFDNLEALRAAGKGLLYTTHHMEEAERLCDRIVVIDQGRVVAQDTVRGLSKLLPASNRLFVELDVPAQDGPWLDGLRALPGVVSVAVAGDRLELALADLTAAAPQALGWLTASGHGYHHLRSERGDLEAVFLALTGKTLRDS
ncbi:MAG: ABC transporter ATP-binding protein [Vicinamibacteria bacterium]